MRRSGYGISLEVPSDWSSAIIRRPVDVPETTAGPLDRGAGPRASVGLVERTRPVVHVCTRPLPSTVGDFGGGVVEALGPDDLFVALLEYGSDLADTGLFERRGMPRLAPSQFAENRMPRDIVGRSASQHFFSEGGRAFCLFTVIGSHSRRMATVPRAAAVVRTLRVETAAAMRAKGVVV